MALSEIEIPLAVVNRVRGVAGQQLRAFENESGCSLRIVRQGDGAIVEIQGADAAQCAVAGKLISDFVSMLQNGGQPTLKPQVPRPIIGIPNVSINGQPRAPDPVLANPRFVPTPSVSAPIVPPTQTYKPDFKEPAATRATATISAPQPPASKACPAEPKACSAAPPAQARTAQPAIAASLVEIPLTIADKVQAKAEELSNRSKCNFSVTLERNRGLVRIEHPDIVQRVTARKMLNEVVATLTPPADSYENLPKKVETTSFSKPKSAFSFNPSQPAAALDGWNTPIQRNCDLVSKAPRIVLKNFYKEHPEITTMSHQEVVEFRKANMDTNVKHLGPRPPPGGIPKPILRFEHAFGNYPEILQQLEAKFETPSPIQCQSWPILLSGLDMVGIAQTGTGKTLAFLLPAFIHIRGQPEVSKRYEGPTCLVLSPTRELAIQIYEESVKYAYRNINCACCYGGAVRDTQMRQLQKKPEIIIATPGRLNDLIESLVVDLKKVSYLVLDEADRMLDMGFEPQIRQILHYVPSNRQTVMTSATWPPNVRKLSEKYLCDPIQVIIGSLDLSAALTVTQRVRMVRSDEKFPIVLNLMKSLKPDDRAIVFCGRKITTDQVARRLNQSGIRAESIHGDRDQREREAALRHLKLGKSRVLVATDVASRGLDVPGITVVVNFDFPTNIEDYVHRVGRTGRARKTGSSYTLMTAADNRFAKELVKILQKAKQDVPSWLQKMGGSCLYDYYD